MLYIGVDLGTSAVKLELVDENGNIKNEISSSYPVRFPHPGWSEQDPDDWKKAVLEGIPELLKGFDASQVRGIGAGGQMHGLVVLTTRTGSSVPPSSGTTGAPRRKWTTSTRRWAAGNCPNGRPTSPSPALPRPKYCGCGKTKRRISTGSARSCCPRTTSTMS